MIFKNTYIYSVFIGALCTLIPSCGDYYDSSDKGYDETATNNYINYIREKKLNYRARDSVGTIVTRQLPLNGVIKDNIIRTKYIKKFEREQVSSILCTDKPIVDESTSDVDYSFKGKDFALSNLLYICDHWNEDLGDDKSRTVRTENEKLLFEQEEKAFRNEDFAHDIYFIDARKNINDLASDDYYAVNGFNNILVKILNSHKDSKSYVSPVAMGFSQAFPYISKNSLTDKLLLALYNNNLLPVVSSGFYYNVYIKYIQEYNKDTLVRDYFLLGPCRDYLANCIFSNNTSITRNSNAVVVAALDKNGERFPLSATGPNIWIAAKTDGQSEQSHVERVTMAIADLVARNNTLTIEQIKYILAMSVNNKIGNLSWLGDEITNGWQTNSADVRYSNELGFGLLDFQKSIDLAEQCDFEKNCARRIVKPNYSKTLSSVHCRQKNHIPPYTYSCRILVDDNIQVEKVELSFEGAEFIWSNNINYCEQIGTIKGLANRMESSGYGYEIADIMREFAVTISSSNSKNRYVVKANKENFFGTSAPNIDINDDKEKLTMITVNPFYLEELSKNSYFVVNFSSNCLMKFPKDSVVLKLTGYKNYY